MLSTNEKGSYHTKTLLRAAMKTAGECFEVITDINESVLVPYKTARSLYPSFYQRDIRIMTQL